MVILAPGIPEPDGSLTTPDTLPRSLCAKHNTLAQHNVMSTKLKGKCLSEFLLCVIYVLLGFLQSAAIVDRERICDGGQIVESNQSADSASTGSAFFLIPCIQPPFGHLVETDAMPCRHMFFLTACDRCFNSATTVRLQEDALARLETFLTMLYFFEIARQFRGRTHVTVATSSVEAHN